MKLKKYISLGLASLCCVWATSCLGDLDQEPIRFRLVGKLFRY